jgi:sugar lactone lactonase YvrE
MYVTDVSNNLIREITSSGVVTTLAGGGSVGGTASGHADGIGTAATFYSPTGIALDSSGNVYVADQYNHLIRKINTSGVVTTLAGGGSVGGTAGGYADGSGTAATFYHPGGVAVDSSGNVYVADNTYCLIREITISGVVSTLAGGGSAGGTASGHADGIGTAATFNSPGGVAVDASGNLYIADSSNNLIRKMQ